MQRSAKQQQLSRTVELFEKIDQIGQGTYGEVYSAKDRTTQQKVALKKVRMEHEKEGFPITAIREIKILKKIRHKNIVHLIEVVTSKIKATTGAQSRGHGNIYLVFEYCSHDLTGLIESEYSQFFTKPQVKCYMKQLLEGVGYLHTNNIVHRDIKPSNILINSKGEVKLGDFGLSRSMEDKSRNFTNRVVTLWYRSPELLLGTSHYGAEIDVWACGCIFGELLWNKPLLPARNEAEQVQQIWRMCGTPGHESNQWDAAGLPYYEMHKPKQAIERRIEEILRQHTPREDWLTTESVDLLDKMLTLDPKRRITAKACLDAQYFWVDPMPMLPEDLPTYPPCYEYTKRKVQVQKNNARKKTRM